jgi:hypothetical protein
MGLDLANGVGVIWCVSLWGPSIGRPHGRDGDNMIAAHFQQTERALNQLRRRKILVVKV